MSMARAGKTVLRILFLLDHSGQLQDIRDNCRGKLHVPCGEYYKR